MVSKYVDLFVAHHRACGSLIGLLVGALVSFSDDLAANAATEYAVAAVVAGTVGGFFFGPPAMQATDDATWFGLIAAFAVAAVAVGALVVTLPMAAQITTSPDIVDRIVATAGLWFAFWLLGVLLLGLPSLLLTVPAATAWAVVMMLLADRERRTVLAPVRTTLS